MCKKLILAALIGVTLSATYAQAGVRISLGLSLPIFCPPPRPVYVAPAPVYVVPPPAPVVYRSSPVYIPPAPVYVQQAAPAYVQPAPVPMPR
jgi:hypothetical protein